MSTEQHRHQPIRGAYGLSFQGVDTCSPNLVDAQPDWPLVTIERVADPVSVTCDLVEGDWAEYRSTDRTGTVRLDRSPLVARFRSLGEPMSDEALLHPGLAMMSAIVNRWLDRDAIHAGAFVTEQGAWAVLGAKEAGKSSLLARLSMLGAGIVCDDVLVVEHGRVFAGPRFVDLRQGAAEHLGTGEDIGFVGMRRRWRMPTGAVPASVPLLGWILPEWGDEIRVESLPPALRLPTLYANLALIRVPRDPFRILDLAALPFLSFRRPRRWESLDHSLAFLLDRIDARISPTVAVALP